MHRLRGGKEVSVICLNNKIKMYLFFQKTWEFSDDMYQKSITIVSVVIYYIKFSIVSEFPCLSWATVPSICPWLPTNSFFILLSCARHYRLFEGTVSAGRQGIEDERVCFSSKSTWPDSTLSSFSPYSFRHLFSGF